MKRPFENFKRLLVLLTVLLLSTAAGANDGVYYTSGNQLIPLAETDISVKKEILTISLQDNGLAKVDVYYEFLNSSQSAKTVKMGFEADPSYNDDYEFYADGVHPHIHDFTVEFNGKKLSHKNAVCNTTFTTGFHPIDGSKYKFDDEAMGDVLELKTSPEQKIEHFAYVYYFDATFNKGINKVHHTYTYRMSQSIGTLFSVPYKLTPAARWANKQIDDFTLVIRVDKTAKHFLVFGAPFGKSNFTVTEGMGKIRKTSKDDAATNEISLRNGAVTLHKLNYRPEHELEIVSADAIYSYEDNAKIGDFYDRTSITYMNIRDTQENATEHLSEAMRKRVLKNLPYANRGHVFKDASLRKYFESLWWYMPDPTYKDDTSDFTSEDWIYVNWGK